MSRDEAIRKAQDILCDEANELAVLCHQEEFKNLPHRAKVAIQNELQEFRKISELIGQPLTPPKNEK
jgi:acyl-CoA reductase-like NAD-dependent aldehyde dehydrogenase